MNANKQQQMDTQRQFSSSTTIDHSESNPNMSTNSVLHNNMQYQNEYQNGNGNQNQMNVNTNTNNNNGNGPSTPEIQQHPQVPQITVFGSSPAPTTSTQGTYETTDGDDSNATEEKKGGKKKKRFGLFKKKNKK